MALICPRRNMAIIMAMEGMANTENMDIMASVVMVIMAIMEATATMPIAIMGIKTTLPSNDSELKKYGFLINLKITFINF